MPTAGNKLSRMFRQSPDYYRESLIMAEIWGTVAQELAAIGTNDADILAQLNIYTATWGLDIWETTLKITYEPDKPDSQRRERIISRLRGPGVANAELIKSVVSSFIGGTVEIINNSAGYSFAVKFIDTYGIPEDMGDVEAAVDDIKPAHLAVTYLFLYFLWADQDSLNLVWTDRDDLKLTWADLEVFDVATTIIRASVGLTMCEQ